MSKRKFNDYKINGDITIIYLKRKSGEIFECLIDTKNLQRLIDLGYSWHVVWRKDNQSYYASCTIYQGTENGKCKYKLPYMHDFLMNIDINNTTNHVVDHIDPLATLDNRECNLRIIERHKNSKNRKGKNSNNTSGYRNVLFDKRRDLWLVRLQIDKKGKTLGEFTDVHEAGRFAEEMRQKYYGKFAGKS